MQSNEGEDSPKNLSAVTELVKAVPIYQDALQPMMKETGKALSVVGRAVNAALGPVRGLVWGAEKVEEWITTKVAKKLENIPPDQIITPDLSIAGPTIEALKFNGHKQELSEMFASILAGAMRKDYEHKIHPSFIEKIKLMTSLDSRIFQHIALKVAVPTIDIIQIQVGIDGHSFLHSFVNEEFIKIYLSLRLPSDSAYTSCQISIEHLSDLGLIEASRDGHLTSKLNQEEYDRQMNLPVCTEFLKRSIEQYSIQLKRSYVRTTQLGKNFFEVIK